MTRIAKVLFLLAVVVSPYVVLPLSPHALAASSSAVGTDTFGAAVTLDEADSSCVLGPTIAAEGQQGVSVWWADNDADATLVAKVSYNEKRTWADAALMHKTSGVVSLSFVGDGANTADEWFIIAPSGFTHATVCLSAYTSGSITPRLVATARGPLPLLGTDGTNLRSVTVTNDTPDSGAYAIVARIVGSQAGGTSLADDAAFTVGTTSFTPVGGTYKSTLDSVDDNDGGAFAMTIKRALYVSHLTPAGDSMVDDTNDALKTSPVTTITIGGQSATSTTLAYPNGAGNLPAFIRPSTATTTLWITGESSEHIYVTSMFVQSSGTQGLTFISGTGATCGTGQETVLGEVETTAQTGWTLGNGAGLVLRTKDAGDSLCVITDAAVAVNILGTYAIY